jgi:nickel transport protein
VPHRGVVIIARRTAFVAALMLVTGPAAAHQTLHEERRGQGVAVRVYESDGQPLSGTPWEVYSPVDPGRPWQAGQTDRDGWLSFVPGVPGRWRVRVIEATGHGLDIGVEVAPMAPGSAASAPPPAPTSTAADLAVRPLLGLAVIGLVFTALLLAWRKKGARPRR